MPEPGTLIEQLLQITVPEARDNFLEQSLELEKIYAKAAASGQSPVPDNAEEEVDFHYVAFVKLSTGGHVYELDGDGVRPLYAGLDLKPEEDMLCDKVVDLIKARFDDASPGGYNLMSLTQLPL